MGLDNCKTVQNVSVKPQYYFKQLEYDINSGNDEQGMKETCKIEVRINKVNLKN